MIDGNGNVIAESPDGNEDIKRVINKSKMTLQDRSEEDDKMDVTRPTDGELKDIATGPSDHITEPVGEYFGKVEFSPAKEIQFQEYQRRQFTLKEELEKINVKKQTMLDNMKKMNTTDFKKKYGNPTRIWAMLTWDIIKLKKQMESL